MPTQETGNAISCQFQSSSLVNSDHRKMREQLKISVSQCDFLAELKFLICFSLPQGHPRCRCLCFHSIFNFHIFKSNCSCLSVI